MNRTYQCTNCNRKVKKLVSLTDKQEPITCSACGSTSMRIITMEAEKLPKRGMGAKTT